MNRASSCLGTHVRIPDILSPGNYVWLVGSAHGADALGYCYHRNNLVSNGISQKELAVGEGRMVAPG